MSDLVKEVADLRTRLEERRAALLVELNDVTAALVQMGAPIRHRESGAVAGHGHLQKALLKFAATRDSFRGSEAARALGREPNDLGATYGRLVMKGLLERPSHGIYKITPKGRAEASA